MTSPAGRAARLPAPSSRGSRQTSAAPSEDGSVSLLLVVAVLAMLIAVGLVVDGGQKLRSTQRADDAAAEAARAAVLSVQPGSTVRGQRPQINTAAAVRAGQDYLSAAGVTGTVSVSNGQVQVSTSTSFTPAFLSLIGLGRQTVTGRSAARLARGVDQEQS
jgi:Flp pilus assembly protein TadG